MNFVTFATDHAGHGLMTIRCPLCASPDTRCRELIDGRDLKALYAQYLGIAGALKAAQLEYRECANCRLGFFWPLETSIVQMCDSLAEIYSENTSVLSSGAKRKLNQRPPSKVPMVLLFSGFSGSDNTRFVIGARDALLRSIVVVV